ncbi:Na+/H+ antiporter NhaC [Emergencia timonensis]|uniref:Na+/H+ antiporter NhaC n=2 Tax=Emergencia timonensis TaxID=1776384 RepID=A0A415E0Z1_9FIRM|nr:Na+/H+ antiporter NhaC [Clostridiales bacterium]RHJ87299.1 Na+/H+ antiporter NhaC [Emergencia timonensis]
MMTEAKKPRLPNKFEACIPIIVLLGLMMCNYLLDWGQDPHIPVLLAACTACFVGKFCGQKFKNMLAAGIDSISQSMEALLILIFVGCLVGSFEWCGTIPALVFYGLKMFTPVIFLPAVCILCAIVGLSLGSAYTVSATLGIAFMTIGETMGISPALIAGAVLSGACTGDKFSPLSDSTNLAAASAQTGLFDHVRAMTMTTFPAFILALLGFTAVAIFGEVGEYDPTMVNQLSDAIEGNFKVMNPVLLLPILVIIVVAVMKLPALPGVLLVSGIGCVFAVVFQGASFSDCITMVHYGYSAETGNELADTLLNRGGMNSMLWTINVALIAIGFGGIYSQIGAVESLLGKFIKRVHTPFQMVLTTILTAMFCIATMCDQYLGLIVPATMYKEKYDDLGLGRNLLSRSMEDGGTLWSPMIPWSSCGAYHSRMLGVDTLSYIPFCFTNILNPIISILTAWWGGNILYADGTFTNFFGKLKKGNPAAAPEEAHETAMENLAERRKNGTYKSLE